MTLPRSNDRRPVAVLPGAKRSAVNPPSKEGSVPAIRMIRDRFPSIKTTVYVPAQAPQRGYAVELRTAAHKHRVLPLNLLKLAQFPTQVADGSGGAIEKPAAW